MPVGLYISVPFCRTKCTYCNFASDVFSRAVFENYVARVCAEISASRQIAERLGCLFESQVGSIYFGGGTPTLLDVAQLDRVFVTIRQNFEVARDAEITVECAPGTLDDSALPGLTRNGVNRLSLGVQSFIDQEARSVGRLHNRAMILNDIARLREAGITNLNVDLIAGLPHQTAGSWRESLDVLIETAVPHASVYMLEVDEDSRLGRELIAGGQKYHAHFVPDEDVTADLYGMACQRLQNAGIIQYEISNFARPGFRSQHNLKYWTRQPYLGFGVDAHSMLHASGGEEAVRFSNPDTLEKYVGGEPQENLRISRQAAIEETFFLGLRLNDGVGISEVRRRFGEEPVERLAPVLSELAAAGLLSQSGDRIRLTARGRLLSNEVFQRIISVEEPGIVVS